MNDQKHKIVLNGKVYDVKTGQMVDTSSAAPVKKSTSTNHHSPTLKVIDGVIGGSHPKKPQQNQHKAVINSHSRPPQTPTKISSLHTPHNNTIRMPHKINHVKKHHPKKAATLMRSAVPRPPKHSEMVLAGQNAIVAPDKEGRLLRAKTIRKSHQIQRFPVSPQSAEDFLAPPVISVSEESATTPTEMPITPKVTPTNHQSPKTKQEKIFEKAIENANSHKEIPRSNHQKNHRTKIKTKRRTFRYASGAFAVVLLTGFVLYQNIPNLSMRIASSKAGFNASLPGYNPSGFALSGPVVYSPGKITVNFSSNSDDRNYSLTQQVSNWNSQALIDNYFVVNNREFQTYQEKGKTIFLYGDKNATWVSGGVWYQIQDADELSSDQILNIASST